LTVFLSQVPKGDEPFTFIGFMPRKEKQIIDLVQNNSDKNIIFYDSPKRLLKTLEILKNYNLNLNIAIGRELTKIFEEIIVMNVCDVFDYYSNNLLKGEIVGMIYKHADKITDDIPFKELNLLKQQNFSNRDIAKILHALYGVDKNVVLKNLS